MPTKTATRPRTAGTLAVDRIEYRPTGERTNNGKPIAAIYVDDVRVGEVAKAKCAGWIYTGPGVLRPGYYLPDTKTDAAALLVRHAVEAGTIRDMDEDAALVAKDAAGQVDTADPACDAIDLAAARLAAGYHALRVEVREGDYVSTADGRLLRVGMRHEAHAATKFYPAREARVQLTTGGSWWMSSGGSVGSYSGGFDGGAKVAELVDTGETLLGPVQMWHHGTPGAGNAVRVLVPFRVFAVPTGVDVARF